MYSRRTFLRSTLALAFAFTTVPSTISAQGPAGQEPHWVATWGTAQELYRAPPAAPATTPAATAPTAPGFRASRSFHDQTVRMIVRSSLGGSRARIRLANAFGTQPVEIGAASIALSGEGAAIVPGSDRAITFAGQPSITIQPGAVVLSDPIDFSVPARTDLAVSLYLPDDTGRPTAHALGLRTTYISATGDFSRAQTIAADTTTRSYYWLAAVEVLASPDAGAVVGFGDSITDGAGSTPDAVLMWPALLAERLGAAPGGELIGVVNKGISGNQVLRDAAGVSALARLDRDVLSQAGVRWMILLEGINDIGHLGRQGSTVVVTADELIWAYQQIIERAHAAGVKVIGATLTPFEGAGYFSEAGESVRQAVNQWIRTSGAFHAVIDFDLATRDPANPRRLHPDYDPGDHLHPNDAGYRAMAEAIDLAIFR